MLVLIGITFLIANTIFFYSAATDFTAAYKLPGKLENIQGRRVHYIEKGKGPCLLLVPDLGFSAESLEPIVDAFSSRYHVIALDMLGQGYTDKPSDIPYAQDDYNLFLEQFFSHKHIANATIFVQGNAGFLLGRYARAYPQRISKIIFWDHTPRNPWLLLDSDLISTSFLGEALVTFINRSMIESFIRKAGYEHPLTAAGKLVDILAKYWGLPGAKPAYLKSVRHLMIDVSPSAPSSGKAVYLYSERFNHRYHGMDHDLPNTHLIPHAGTLYYWENLSSFSVMISKYI